MFIATWMLMLRGARGLQRKQRWLWYRTNRRRWWILINTSTNPWRFACNFFGCEFKDVHDMKDVKVCRIAFLSQASPSHLVPRQCTTFLLWTKAIASEVLSSLCSWTERVRDSTSVLSGLYFMQLKPYTYIMERLPSQVTQLDGQEIVFFNEAPATIGYQRGWRQRRRLKSPILLL